MLLRTLLAAALLVASAALAAADDLELKAYFSGDGRYRVLLPEDVKTSEGKQGNTVTKTATALIGGQAALAVTYLDIGVKVPADQVKGVLTGYINSLPGPGGKVLSTKDATVGSDKLRCCDALLQQPKAFIRVRTLIVGQRMYQIAAMGTKEFVTSKDADKVLDSFEIVK